MKLGAVFPQTEFGDDPGAVREWTLAGRSHGFRPRLCLRPCRRRQHGEPAGIGMAPTIFDSQFYRASGLVLLHGRVSQKLGFLSGVVILPQRANGRCSPSKPPASMFSATAACGSASAPAGTRSNTKRSAVKYEDRGDIFDEQIEVMRALLDPARGDGEAAPSHDHRCRPHALARSEADPLVAGRGRGPSLSTTTSGSERRAQSASARVADGWLPICQPG